MKTSALLCVLALGAAPAFAATPPAAPPRLAVVITVDQLRADYLTRFRPFFGPDGFNRLLAGGAVFTDAHYRHSVTLTAPGHASILSGVFAETHGVIANSWLDRSSWQVINSVEDTASPLVGTTAPYSPGNIIARKAGRSPKNFRATTVGDQLKLRRGATSRVVSVSNKDRAAILLGGKLADQAYWVEKGVFVTSRHYREQLPDWAAAFNERHAAAKLHGATWERLLDASLYDTVQGPDDAPGESDAHGLARTFPKTVDGGRRELSNRFFNAFDVTPFATEMLGAFAELALQEEKLGHHATTDLFCVSFSQIDTAGHAYGPDSHEIMDSMVRLDRVLARLLAALDRAVGLSNCLIVLTADHGVCPLPERVQAAHPGLPAARYSLKELESAVQRALDAAFGPLPESEIWFTRNNTNFHLRASALKLKQLAAADVARVVRDALLTTEPVAQAFTAEEIRTFPAEGDSLEAMVRRSHHPAISGEVFYTTKPYYFVREDGAAHGSPHNYDTHVPLIWFGAGIAPGVHPRRVGIDDIAPTLSALLQVPAPPEARGHRLF